MTTLALSLLHDDPRNANVCPPETLEKIRQHIERTGICPGLLVRPHPELSGEYIIVDGHHRKRVIEDLGWLEVECQVKDMTEQEAGMLLLTLNRLRGTDIPRKRAELIDELLPYYSVSDLSLMLPESTGEIEGLLALLNQDYDGLAQALADTIETEDTSLPVPFGFMVPAEDVAIVREALSKYQAHRKQEQAAAFVAICRDVLTLSEVNHG